MKKILNILLQLVSYFLIVLGIFFLAKKLGMTDMSIWIGATGSTIGWSIMQIIRYLLKKNKENRK